MSFPCHDAHLHLGLPKASVEKCTELLVDFYRVTLLDGEPRQRLVKTLVWERNGPVRTQGLDALTRYLARTQGFDRKLDPTALGQLIAHFDAAPAGFDPTTLGDTLTPVERRATVSFSPLTVTLFSVGWTPPPKAADPMAGLPPGAMLMPGGPPGAFSAPPGTPGGPPLGTATPTAPRAPGAQVETLARAVMTAHRDPAGHRLVWTVAWRGSQGPYETVEVPVRP